ncbi:hypothetical protein YDYSG_57130 [Paenibacillus tyrfis]|uniref:hypothetical protein n=1 Tax=Paenibacillus tyrfis TaxID=1501230 RepID=UPI0024922E61|nr:hypothetical protein [Paenibacillus tyrfis]GLI09681.1 hypothetical protein YDYSG_57130 [Paenibacillus tyrfis]
MQKGNGTMLRYKPQRLTHSAINRWMTTGLFTKAMRFEPMTMEGDVNDWLIRGFAIHENPCRKEFVERRRQVGPGAAPLADWLPDGLPLPGERFAAPRLYADEAEADEGLYAPFQGREQEDSRLLSWNVYFPWGNPRVEASGFYYVPTHMLRYAYTVVVSPAAHRAVFRLKTCGSVALWANGKLAADFTPFTRNHEQTTEVELELAAGENVLTVCHEDLAERDTLYHFALEYTGGEALELCLPAGSAAEAEAVRRLEHVLAAAYLPSDTVTDGPVLLQLPEPPAEEVRINVACSSFFGGVRRTEQVLAAGQRQLKLGDATEIGTEHKYFDVTAVIGGVRMTKPFGVQTHTWKYEPEEAASLTEAERKRLALRCIAESGAGNIHKALAILAAGDAPEAARELIEDGLAGIRDRRDCADFYLNALFRFWRDYHDCGQSGAGAVFDTAFWEEVRQTMLGFRYWIDEPGDDVMWFFSENHALLFHTCELLAGQLFPEAVFANSGESGAVHRAKAEARLTAWFERFFAEGLAEWNSSAYIPIDIVGLVQLHDLAESSGLRGQAKRALDLLFRYMTITAHDGVLACTYGRSYEKELLGHYAAGTTSLLWAAYGVGHPNAYTFNASFYLSGYEPPAEYAFWQSLDEGEELAYRFEQGKDGYAKLAHYRTQAFSLSSIADFRPGARGYQEHVVHGAMTPEAQVWVNHPGEVYPFGSGRPCFWAGNGYLPKVGQHRALALLLFDIGAEYDADYTHAYFPTFAFTSEAEGDGWRFAACGDAYVALYAAGGMTLTESGPNRGRELVSPGRRNAWIVRLSDRFESGSFGQFAERMRASGAQASLRELSLTLTDPAYGEVTFAWNAPLRVQGQPIPAGGCGVEGCLERKRRSALCP